VLGERRAGPAVFSSLRQGTCQNPLRSAEFTGLIAGFLCRFHAQQTGWPSLALLLSASLPYLDRRVKNHMILFFLCATHNIQ
jgi:hypothetical protein